MRRLPALVGLVLLAACSAAPTKKDPAAATGTPVAPPVGTPTAPAGGGRKVSPYAPAQEDPSTRGDYVAGGLYKPGVKDTTPAYLPDVDAIPEPEVVDEPHSRYGNRSPYTVLGQAYTVREHPQGYVEQGLASYYGNKFHGRKTSNHEVYDMYAFTAAHKSLPLPSFARVTNLDNGKSVVVRVNDRGPFHAGRVVDLSYAAAVKIGVHPRGTGRVEVRGLGAGGNAREDDQAVTAGVVGAAPMAVAAAMPSSPGNGSRRLLPAGVRIATGKPQPMPPSAIDMLVGALPIAGARAGERPPDPAVPAPVSRPAAAGSAPESVPVAAVPGTVPASTGAAPDEDWRFDMRQDGKAMSADQFDAWMRSRRARVATGKAGTPDPYGSAAPASTPRVAPETIAAARQADAAGPTLASATVATPAGAVAPGQGVLLQVAAFGARANAERALGMLQRAGIADARVQDGTAAGKPVFRVRVGPVAAAGVAELSARVAGLGFGAPNVVRD